MKIYSILLIVLLAIQYGYPQKIKRTYRIAIAATGEYTQFHGGTKVSALAAIRASLHQINEIYRKELAIEFELVANNEDIIFTDPNTDPFTKTLPSQLILENQKVIDNYIGNENYDIGHLLSAMPLGSHASLATTCRKGLKARGISTHASPEETHFNIGILAHEIGHQLGAQHTFNGIGGSCLSDSRNEPTAVEPGSGESIMSYAGLCDAQNTSTSTKAFFHYTSLSQIQDQLLHGAVGTCPVKTVSNNQIPKINLAKNTWYISANTPFALTGSATDTNDANLLFSWEQIDTGKIDANENSRFGTLFQSYLPSTSKTRTFPKLPLLLNGINTQFGEALPTEARVLNFAFTVRDHHSRGGAFASEKVQLRVIDSKPFEMLMGTKTLYWTGGETQKIQWDVSSTKDKPIQANYVNIWFSEDGGLTFPYLLASQTLNDGSEYVHIPNIETKLGRVKIQPVNHIFFAVNQAYIQVASNTSAYFTLHKLQSTYTLCHNTPLIIPLQVKKHRAFSGTVTLRAQLPTAWQATFTQTQIKPPFTAYCHVSVKNANYSVLREGQLQIQAVGKKWSQRQDIQLSYRKVPRVENLVITQVSHNEIKLQWSSITEGTQVLISQSLGADFSIIGIEKALENHYTVPHLDTNTLYYYTARAQDANCVSDLSNIASKTTLKRIIEPPSDISFTEVKPTSLSISWKDNSKNEHLFKLYRRQKGSNTFEELAVLPVNSTYFKDVSVAQGTAYEYQVCAHIGTVSFECSTIAIAKTPPLPVSDFSYKYLTTHTVVLHWKASLKSGFYTIRRKKLHHGDVPIVEIKIPHSISQFVDTDLEEGIQYEYEITSENEVGTSTTTSLFITTPIEEIPQSPEELDAVQVGQTEANLIWKDQSSNERGFVVFRAEKGKAFVPIANLYENINHYRDRFLQPEKSYRYRVQAYNEKGTSNYSNILNVNTLPYPPQIPQWIKFEEIEQPRVHLEWSSVANASHYRIERKFMNTSFIKIGTTKNTSFQDQNLQFARQYSYRIIAVNRGGDSRPSEEKSLTIIQKIPSPPTALTLVSVS